MATATSISLNVRDHTRPDKVAEVDHARLMYYLSSISLLGPRRNQTLQVPKRLTDYANYQQLTFQEIRSIVEWCHHLAPDQAKVKEFATCDPNGEVCKDTKNAGCTFLNISADYDVVSVRQRSIVAGSVKGVGERVVLFYTPTWLETVYTNPLKNVSRFHCYHCIGVDGYPCSCMEGCDRPAKSQCHVLRPDEHRFQCDGCKDRLYVMGVLYICTVCTNYGLCRRCYLERQADHLTHPFEEVVSPGATPRRLAPRKAPLLPPRPPVSSQSTANTKDLVTPTAQLYTKLSGLSPSTMTDIKSPTLGKASFRKDDTVVLKGLTKTEMNGKEATVLSVDVVEQKVQIQVVGMEKTFKVKWANVESVEEELE